MSKKDELNKIRQEIEHIRRAMERSLPPIYDDVKLSQGSAFIWQGGSSSFSLVRKIQALPLELLLGIERAKDTLMNNSLNFAQGLPANNALLWGVRGMGKSSLVKSVFLELRDKFPELKIIEIHREDIDSLPLLLQKLRSEPDSRFILFCDDLSFDAGETSYKSLKAVLEGGLEGRPSHVLFYATSNRRHILARDMSEQSDAAALMPSDAASEKISLSDRFGLWLGFHNCNQDEYLEMITSYIEHYKIKKPLTDAHKEALEWATTRGSRSGRVAWQFIQNLAGELKIELN